MPEPKKKTKALCVATRCTSVEQFVSTFHRFCDESTFFVATLATRPVGLDTAFSIQLADKTPVLRGLCSVVEAWSTPANQYGRPGVRLAVRRLTDESIPVFAQLQAARKAAESSAMSEPPEVAHHRRAEPPPNAEAPVAVTAPAPAAAAHDAPEPISASDELTHPIASESRVPGSSLVLPANPLMNLTDKSLEGFIDCSLYEETATFFRAPEDEGSLGDIGDVAAPPPPSTLAPVPALLPATAGPDVIPAATPMPLLARDEAPVPADPAPPQQPSPVLAPRATASPPVESAPALRPAGGDTGRRWPLIGGVAAGVSLLGLVLVLAAGGGKGGRHDAEVPPATIASPIPKVVEPTVAVAPPPPSKPAVVTAKLTIALKPDAISKTAKVSVDGAEIKDGATELELGDTRKKEVTVAVKAAGYDDVEQKLEIEGDRTVTIDLVKRPPGGVLKRPPLRGGGFKKKPPRGGLSDI